MPTYLFKNIETGEEFEKQMSMKELDGYKTEHPELQQIIGSSTIVSGSKLKPDQSFRDVLKEIKSKHDATWTRSTINTF